MQYLSKWHCLNRNRWHGPSEITNNLAPSIELPLGLKATDTREDVERKLGAPDRSLSATSDYRAYYIDEGVVIRYKSRDEANMNNPIKSISVEQVKPN